MPNAVGGSQNASNRLKQAWEARSRVPKKAIRGRSTGNFEVLTLLAKNSSGMTTGEVSAATGMKERNARRVLERLMEFRQVRREVSHTGMLGSVPRTPKRLYFITERGRARFQHMSKAAKSCPNGDFRHLRSAGCPSCAKA